MSYIKRLLFGAIALMFILSGNAFGQGVTTGAVSGTIVDNSGQPIGGANVTLVHEPSGTRATTVTRTNGQYNISGLRVGGPYTLTVEDPGYKKAVVQDLAVNAGNSIDANATLVSEVVTMEAFNISASTDTTFVGKMGTSTTFSERDIANVSSVRRSIQDVAVLDSRLYLGSLDQGGQLSAQGQNFRYNSLLVDGVRSDDQFGLNSNGFSALRSPVPLEAIQSLSVELNPYSGRFAGFTGALINTTIKSGTNEFHGSGSYEYTDEKMRAKNPLSGAHEPFKEKAFTATLGGPIIQNKLFFFFAYDDFKRTTTQPQAIFVPNATELAAIVARAKTLGYDPGSLTGSNASNQKTYIGKVDWNISDSQRLSLTYRRNYGEEAIFPNYTGTGTTSLSQYWYQQPRNTDSYVAQLNSQWTSNFRTEATASYTKYDGSPKNNGQAFPQVLINGVSGTRATDGASIVGGVYLGTESSRQLNALTSKESQGKLVGEWSLGDHTISMGLEDVSTKYVNAFIQYTNGYYIFGSTATPGSGTAAWQVGTPPSGYTLVKPYPGNSIDDAIARWKYDNYAMFLEDTWRPNSQLTLLYGFRFDYPYIGEAPPVAAGFQSAFGMANNSTNSGNYTVAPRVGFNYSFKSERRTQLRGGVGLFQGKNPAVWISNAYSNAGSIYSYGASTAELAGITFNPNPNTQSVPGSASPAPNINVTDKGFKQPTLWKSNLALDHALPFGGLNVTAEAYYNLVDQAVQTLYLNYQTDAVNPLLPDGRIHYAGTIPGAASTSTSTGGRRRVSNFADVFYLTNTNKGYAWGTTLALSRPFRNNWSWSVSWTQGDAKEVSPITSSTASSNYSNRASFNPNENTSSISNTSIRNRIVASVARQFNIIKNAPTTVSLIYQGRTGHPYSWVFYGDANGDGFTFNDLLYVPTGPNDPKVTWADTAQRDAFFAYVQSSDLKNYMGSHAPRNNEVSPWLNTIDFKFTQALPIYKKAKAELYVNIINIANFFDKSWGIQEEVPFSYRRAVASAGYNAANNTWAYTFNPTTLNTVVTTVNDTPVSRWQILAGMRVKF